MLHSEKIPSIYSILPNAVKKKVPDFNDKQYSYACITRCNLGKISRCTTRTRKDKRKELYIYNRLCYILTLLPLDNVQLDI